MTLCHNWVSSIQYRKIINKYTKYVHKKPVCSLQCICLLQVSLGTKLEVRVGSEEMIVRLHHTLQTERGRPLRSGPNSEETLDVLNSWMLLKDALHSTSGHQRQRNVSDNDEIALLLISRGVKSITIHLFLSI